MDTLADIIKAVESETSVFAGVETLLKSLYERFTTAKDSGDPSTLTTVLDEVKEASGELSQAVVTNTPADPAAEDEEADKPADTGTGIPAAGIATRAP